MHCGRRWRIRPVHAGLGLLPTGRRTTGTLERRLEELHPDQWPTERFWVTAVRLTDGRRVVLGRDDIAATAARAVRASCAVPARYQPVGIGSHRYVDGGVHSSTNADLAGPPAFDLVVISSAMTVSGRTPGRSLRVLRRGWMSQPARYGGGRDPSAGLGGAGCATRRRNGRPHGHRAR